MVLFKCGIGFPILLTDSCLITISIGILVLCLIIFIKFNLLINIFIVSLHRIY